MQQQHQGKTSRFYTGTSSNAARKHGRHDDGNRNNKFAVHAGRGTADPSTFLAGTADEASGNARGRRWFVGLLAWIIIATSCVPERKTGASGTVQAQGLILIAHPDAETLRRQCEASAAGFKSQYPHSVQLIQCDSISACIRVFGSQEQFTQLMNRLRYPDSGWKPHKTFSGWWQQQYLFRHAGQQGILLSAEANGSCLRWNLNNGTRTRAAGQCAEFSAAPLNPDTLQFLESTSFE